MALTVVEEPQAEISERFEQTDYKEIFTKLN